MITYFFRFFEQLVHDGRVYVLETPLFRVRNKEKTIYCYSETERDIAVKELGGQPLTPSLSPSDGGEGGEAGRGATQKKN